MTKERKLDCLQVVAEASLIYELDRYLRTVWGKHLISINRIPYEEPPSEDHTLVLKAVEKVNKETGKKKRKTPKNAGTGRLQNLIREMLTSGKKTQPEISRAAREEGMSSGNTRRALDRMHARGEVRRFGIYWMRKENGK